jgi:hypothetical protein
MKVEGGDPVFRKWICHVDPDCITSHRDHIDKLTNFSPEPILNAESRLTKYGNTVSII